MIKDRMILKGTSVVQILVFFLTSLVLPVNVQAQDNMGEERQSELIPSTYNPDLEAAKNADIDNLNMVESLIPTMQPIYPVYDPLKDPDLTPEQRVAIVAKKALGYLPEFNIVGVDYRTIDIDEDGNGGWRVIVAKGPVVQNPIYELY